jgi:hypothetical protein
MLFQSDQRKHCQEIERLIVLYACGELEAVERARVEEHLKTCVSCAALADREQRLLQVVTTCQPAEPSPVLLTRCRNELKQAVAMAGSTVTGWQRLAEAFAAARRQLSALAPANWLERFSGWRAVHPVWSAAVLILIGAALGSIVPRGLRRENASFPPSPSMTISALSDRDLRNAAISGINWLPGGSSQPPSIEVHLTAQTPVILRGTVDDSDVKRLLSFVLENSQQFDSGVRLDSVEVLKNRGDDTGVRQALCYAARSDRNPGVRLKALEALRGFEQNDQVRQTLLEALMQDENTGVRVEAINALKALAEQRAARLDAGVIKVLRDRMQRDPNPYIRIQSAAAIRWYGTARADEGPRQRD